MKSMPEMFHFKAWINRETFRAVARLAKGGDGTPYHKAMRTLNHIHVVDRIFVGNLQSQPHGFTALNTPETPDVASLEKAVAQTDEWFVKFTESLPESELGRPIDFKFVDGTSGRMTGLQMLIHVALHGAYHRGAVGQILTDAGIEPPREIYTHWLHSVSHLP